MKFALATLALLLLAGCGGGSDKPSGPSAADKSEAAAASASAEASASADAALEQTCAKLGRTWLVEAKKAVTKLYLALPIDEVTEAMTEATEQMNIEGCKGDMVDTALDGNYEATLISTNLLTCGTNLDCGEVAGAAWEKKMFPLMLKVEGLVA